MDLPKDGEKLVVLFKKNFNSILVANFFGKSTFAFKWKKQDRKNFTKNQPAVAKTIDFTRSPNEKILQSKQMLPQTIITLNRLLNNREL